MTPLSVTWDSLEDWEALSLRASMTVGGRPIVLVGGGVSVVIGTFVTNGSLRISGGPAGDMGVGRIAGTGVEATALGFGGMTAKSIGESSGRVDPSGMVGGDGAVNGVGGRDTTSCSMK